MREMLPLKTIARRSAFAMAGLVLAGTIDVASASTSTGLSSGAAEYGSQQSIRLAEVETVTKPKNVTKTGKTSLNPQPEPPMGPAKVDKGGTWLNPQPEPPRPDTGTKNPH